MLLASSQRRTLFWAFYLLCLLGFGFYEAWNILLKTASAGLDYPLGSDPTLWGKAALMARYDAPQTIPPAFPELASFLAQSDSLVQGAIRANVVGLCLTIVSVGLGTATLLGQNGRSFLAGGVAAWVAAKTLYLSPSVLFFQPELLTLGAFSFLGLAGVTYLRRQDLRSIALIGIATGILFSTREHGLVVVLALIVLLPFALPPFRRWLGMLFFVLGLQLGGGIAAGAPTQPFFFPHGGFNGSITKASIAIGDSLSLAQGNKGAISKGIKKEGAQNTAYLKSMSDQAAQKASDFYPSFAVAVLGCIGVVMRFGWKGSLLCAALFSPLVASLLVWTQWRHFFVLSGMSIIFTCGGIPLIAPRFLRFPVSLAVCLIGAHLVSEWQPYQERKLKIDLYRLITEQKKHVSEQQQAQYLRENAEDGSVVMASDVVAILAGLPPIKLHDREIHARKNPQWPNFIYRTYLLAERAPSVHWEQQAYVGGMGVFRWPRPEGISQECLYGEWTGRLVEKVPDHLERPQPSSHSKCP